ncbi:hypothetical protein Tco_0816692 [Tanacetum coccineum]
MMVQAHEEMGEGSEIPTDPHHTPTITQPSTSQPQKKQKPRRKQRKGAEIPLSSGEPIADEAANEEHVPKHSNNLLLSGNCIFPLGEKDSDGGVLFMIRNTKTTQALEIESLKRRVKKLEKKQGSRTYKLKRLYMVGLSAKIISSDDEGYVIRRMHPNRGWIIDNIDVNEGVTLVDETQGRNDEEMFDISVLNGEEVFVGHDMAEKEVSAADPVTTVGEVVTTISTTATISPEEVTLAQALVEHLLRTKVKVKMVEPKPVKKFSKKEQIRLDEEVDTNLQAQLQAGEEEKKEVEILSYKKGIREIRGTDHQLKAHKRSIMFSTYLYETSGYKHNQLKNKSFNDIQKLFDKEMRRVNIFVDMDTDLVKGTDKKDSSKKPEVMEEISSKRAREELEQEKEKKQKIVDDQEEAEMKKLIEIVPDEEEVAVDAIPLATKPPIIID